MDSNNFKHVLIKFPENPIEEVQEILVLKKRYPYSQVLHALAARLSKDHNLDPQNQELQLAAIYATDRSVLKEVMVATSDDKIQVQTSNLPVLKTEQQTILDGRDTVAEEVMRDLERLNELKHNFELLFVDGLSHPVVETSSSNIDKAKEKPVQTKVTKKDDDGAADKVKEKSGLTRKQRIIALAKASDALAQAQALDKNLNSPTKKKKSSADPVEGLIEEIVSTKQEINPESEKQKEQIEIIDQFIKAQPTIVNKDRLSTIPSADLTTIKSGEFGDNVVSETLVDILIQQGKKDKAIEVLKKLIWKFPQKKAYFAAQIEELKK